MRILFFSLPVTVAVDLAAWMIIQLGVSKLMISFNSQKFNPSAWLFRERRWERGGKTYEALFVKKWKDHLPDAGPWFKGGFPKSSLSSRSTDFLNRFVLETCRGELSHWTVMWAAPLFFLWNRPWVGGLMVAYAVLGNLPCIIVQRYNRIRLARLLQIQFIRSHF
jgi:glycosyl-4,4'-diaponeurosporenoate acyltransferase